MRSNEDFFQMCSDCCGQVVCLMRRDAYSIIKRSFQIEVTQSNFNATFSRRREPQNWLQTGNFYIQAAQQAAKGELVCRHTYTVLHYQIVLHIRDLIVGSPRTALYSHRRTKLDHPESQPRCPGPIPMVLNSNPSSISKCLHLQPRNLAFTVHTML